MITQFGMAMIHWSQSTNAFLSKVKKSKDKLNSRNMLKTVLGIVTDTRIYGIKYGTTRMYGMKSYYYRIMKLCLIINILIYTQFNLLQWKVLLMKSRLFCKVHFVRLIACMSSVQFIRYGDILKKLWRFLTRRHYCSSLLIQDLVGCHVLVTSRGPCLLYTSRCV